MRAFRMDDRKQRLIVDGGFTDGERFFGWEVADATALDALATRLEKAGVAVRRETTAVADQRCAAEVISFRDPAGNRVGMSALPPKADIRRGYSITSSAIASTPGGNVISSAFAWLLDRKAGGLKAANLGLALA